MSKIKLKSNDNGTGVISVESPNTNTDRTLSLPDSTGTLATTTGGVAQLDHSGTKKLEATSTGATLTGDLAINDAHPEITLTDSDDTSYSVAYHSAGAFLIDVDKGQDVANSYFRLSIDDTPRLRVTADGLLFNADTAASNALNDYEEGSHNSVWTASGGGTISPNRSYMAYTKIGNMVHMTGEVDIASVSSLSGYAKFTLPFVIATSGTQRDMNWGGGGFGAYHINYYENNPPIMIGHEGNSYVQLVYQRNDSSFIDFQPAANDTFFFSFSYKTN